MKKEDKKFSNYLSTLAELKLQEKIEEAMRGRPGLLIRNFKKIPLVLYVKGFESAQLIIKLVQKVGILSYLKPNPQVTYNQQKNLLNNFYKRNILLKGSFKLCNKENS